MAEFVASLIGIASLGAKVSITLHKVASTLQSAQSDARLIAADISIFTCTLTQLSKTISNCNVPEATQLFEIAQVLVPACSALANELHKLIGNTDLYQMKGAFWMHVLALRFKWLLNGPKVTFVKSLLESFKSTLVLLISAMDLAVVIHQDAHNDVKESLKSQVRTNLHLAEDAKANLLLFKDPQANNGPPVISDNTDSQSTISDALSNATSVIDSPAQSLVPYSDDMPKTKETVTSSQLALGDETDGSTCLSECPHELSGILVAQQSSMKLAENLLNITHVPTWTWGFPAETKPSDLPKHVTSEHKATHVDNLKESASTSEPKPPKPNPENQSRGQEKVSEPEIEAIDTRPAEPLDPLQFLDKEEDPLQYPDKEEDPLQYLDKEEDPLQYLDKEEESQKYASKTSGTNDSDIEAMIRKVLEETLASRNSQTAEQPRVNLDTTIPPQRPILPEAPSDPGFQDGTERLSKLERFMLAERDEMVRKAAVVEAEREAQKKKNDADKLAKLEQLILAQKEEQLKREEAVEAARKAEKSEMDAKVAKEAAEAAAQAEAAARLLEAAKNARQEAEAKAAREAEESNAAHERALAEAKFAQEELEKARKAAEEEAAKLKPTDEPKPPIKFKDAVGRKFSFPWHLCKTWKGMEELIKQAFLHVDVIGPHVHEGHYDLVGPDGEILLPQVWETMVQPGEAIIMHMWPMPEQPPPPPPPPRNIPEKGQKLKVGLSKLFERRSSNQGAGRA